MSRSLILFDIDGTLVSGCGEGIEPFVRAIRDVSGIRIAAGFHDTAGKTDRLILRELLQHQGVTPEQTEEARMLRRYLEHVRALILEKPGMQSYLKHRFHKFVYQTVLTVLHRKA